MTTTEEQTIFATINNAFDSLKRNVANLRMEQISLRKERLNKLRQWIHTNREAIHQAMHNDFRKPAVEVDAIELFHVLNEIKQASNAIDEWTKTKKIDAPLTMLGTRSYIQYEPKGVCLIISPWNYPFSLAVGPLVSALAAGNAVILKPAEQTPNVSSLISRMVSEIFDKSIVNVFEGGPEISQHLLKLPFDHIFFTGSPAIGKLVMKAAAENLTSVTLELGGKSPAIVTESSNLTDAAQRIAAAKFVNNGQTCVAPDYVFVDEKLADRFVDELAEQVKKLFSDSGSFEKSASYCRIVNDKHFERLNELLNDARQSGAKLHLGGDANKSTRFFPPTLITNLHPSARLLEEEIFGPILPILTYKNPDEAIAFVNAKPKPLALYIFTTKGGIRDRVLKLTSSGGVCVNDCGIHFLHHNLPFGGVNGSGIGKSHGYYGFLAFSNEKPVLKQKSGITAVRAFYPPYTSFSKRLMDWFLKLF